MSGSWSASQIRKRRLESGQGVIEDRPRRGEIEAKPRLAARPELRARTCKDACARCDSGGNVFRRQAGSSEIDPRKVCPVETHRSCAGHSRFDSRIEQIAIPSEI